MSFLCTSRSYHSVIRYIFQTVQTLFVSDQKRKEITDAVKNGTIDEFMTKNIIRAYRAYPLITVKLMLVFVKSAN